MLSSQRLVFNNGDKLEFNIGFIGVNSYINSMDIHLTCEDEVVNVQIGNYCSIAYNIVALINRNHDYRSISTSSVSILNFKEKKIKQKGQILIGNDVWIGNNVILLSGIKIGNGAVIGAGTVVSKDVPPYAIVVGNPMKIMKYRFEHNQINKLQEIKWWNWNYEKIERNREWFQKDIDKFINQFWRKVNNPQELIMTKNIKSILFIPDFDEPYPIWRKAINGYINKFKCNDDITLILRIQKDINFERNINMIESLLIGKDDLPDILVVNDIIEDERSLFKNANYFVTTRNINTIKYIEMADEFNVKILSGVDIPIF